MTNALNRCGWVSSDPLYIDYHDKEWGIPIYDNLSLFENICLEGQQAGLSWITVLKKRDAYRQAFCQFNPELMVKITDIEPMMQNSNLIRHRLKLEGLIANAKAYLQMQSRGEDFSTFIWSFVNGKAVINDVDCLKDVPTQSEISQSMSKELKKRGFKFVGPTICYAFMQAVGLVNDHTNDCHCKDR